MKDVAELLQERRRRRRTIVEFCPNGSHQSNGVLENEHVHLEGLLRTMRSDLMEKTGVNVNVKSLLAPWLARHCAWILTRVCNLVQTSTHLSSDNVPKTTLGHLLPNPASNPNQDGTNMGIRWRVVGTTGGLETTRSFRRTPTDQHWNPETPQMFCRGTVELAGASWLTQLEVFANATSRNLWCKGTCSVATRRVATTG